MTKKGKTMKRKPQAFELTDTDGEIGYRWPNPKADSCEIRRDIIDHLVGQVNEARQVATRAMAVLMADRASRVDWRDLFRRYVEEGRYEGRDFLPGLETSDEEKAAIRDAVGYDPWPSSAGPAELATWGPPTGPPADWLSPRLWEPQPTPPVD